jgi:hypothetical protein
MTLLQKGSTANRISIRFLSFVDFDAVLGLSFGRRCIIPP